jgi:beta propeller repeat protein
MYNISSGEESRVTTSESAKYSPAIYGDLVVWADGYMVMSGEKIYVCSITTGETFQLTSEESTHTHEYPAIYGNKIVWLGESTYRSGWNIFMSTLEGCAPADSQEAVEESTEQLENTTEESAVEDTSSEMMQNTTKNQ